MSTASGILRGQLRPGGVRGSPLVVIALLLVLSVIAFNYWTLTSQYTDLAKEIAELQDKLRLAILKREKVEQQNQALQSRLGDNESSYGEAKQEIQRQLNSVKEQLKLKTGLITKLTADMDIITGDLKDAKNVIDKLNNVGDKVTGLETELANWKSKYNDLELENSHLRNQLEGKAIKASHVLANPVNEEGGKPNPVYRASAQKDIEINDQLKSKLGNETIKSNTSVDKETVQIDQILKPKTDTDPVTKVIAAPGKIDQEAGQEPDASEIQGEPENTKPKLLETNDQKLDSLTDDNAAKENNNLTIEKKDEQENEDNAVQAPLVFSDTGA